MREIKFRVWNKRINQLSGCDDIYFAQEPLNEAFKLDEFDFMQYTGLKDANGKEIYEGDIVKYVAGENYENIGVVIWADEINSFNLKTYPFMCGFVIHNEKENKTDKFEWDETNYMEVIGNIYENPELLEEK